MIYVFPIGGKGKRTQELGKIKPFIKVKGKYIFEHLLDNIKFTSNDSIIFITAKDVFPINGEKIIQSKINSLNIKSSEIIILNEIKKGPALTVYYGLNKSKLKIDDNIHIVNADQIINYDSFILKNEGGIMPIWFNSKGSSCYVEIKKNKPEIINIKEKRMISFFASAGVYVFSSLDLLFKSIEWGMEQDIWVKSKGYSYPELFIGPCMNFLIKNKLPVYATATNIKIDLGSTEQIKNKL